MNMSSVDNLIVAALRTGPKTSGELQKELSKEKISRQTFHNHLRKLLNVEKTVRPTLANWKPGEKPETRYELVPEGTLVSPEDQVKTAIARFYNITARYPDAQELALEASVTLQLAEELAYKASHDTGWRPPTDEEKAKSGQRLCDLLFLAAELTQDPIRDWTETKELGVLRHRGYTKEEVALARKYIEQYPDLIPDLSKKTWKWPRLTIKYLGGFERPTQRYYRTY